MKSFRGLFGLILVFFFIEFNFLDIEGFGYINRFKKILVKLEF